MRRVFRLSASLALGLTVAALGCEDAFGPGRSVILPITGLEAPAEVRSTDPLIVRVTIEVAGCRTFTGLDAVKTTNRLTLTARGTDTSGPTVDCPASVDTEVREFRADAPHTDPLTVVANQPDGTTTTRTVRVR